MVDFSKYHGRASAEQQAAIEAAAQKLRKSPAGKHVAGSMDTDSAEQLVVKVEPKVRRRAPDQSLDSIETKKSKTQTVYQTCSVKSVMSNNTPFGNRREVEDDQRLDAERSELYGLLKKGQKRVYEEARSFVLDRSFGNKDLEMLITGGAGCGKTFLTKALVSDLRVSWCCSATTNKATKVLQRNLGSLSKCRTIFSVLGMKMAPDEDLMKLKVPKTPVNLTNYDVIVLDEAGMANEELVYYLRKQSREQGVKLLHIGDEAQLNPVGEEMSKVFETERAAKLTKVLRQDNQILDFATHVRKQVLEYPEGRGIKLRSDNDGTEGVWKLKKKVWLDQIEEAAEAGFFTKPDDTKAIAWRNSTVNELNSRIRRRIFGDKEADKAMWLPGDRVSVRRPVPDPDKPSSIIGFIDDEGTVTSVTDVRNSHYREYAAHRVTLAVDDGPNLVLEIANKKSEIRLLEDLARLARAAVKNPKEWGEFWALKNAFHEVAHSYAQTAHRSQGSTYVNVFAEASEILANQEQQEALRCFYVTSSRPTTRLILT